MIDWSTVRLPIVVFSTARSGSTALAHHIHRKLVDVALFQEPEQDEVTLADFLSSIAESKRYIVKTHSDGFVKYPKWLSDYFISDEPFKICIRRRNQIDQYLSLYIETYRQQWSYREGQPFSGDLIEIDEQKMKGSILWIMRQTAILDRMDVNFDCTIWYEDFTFDDPGVIRTPRPSNHNELYAAMSAVYKNLTT